MVRTTSLQPPEGVVVYRAHQPPPLFVGRQRELVLATEALARRGVLVVSGLGGMGKTSFLRAVLNNARPVRAVEVRAAPAAGLRELVEALRAAWGESDPLRGDDGAVAFSLVTQADENRAAVLLDDAHLLAPGVLELVVRTFSGYATAAMLLVGTRIRPDMPDLVEQCLSLSPLDSPSLETLVRTCIPGADDELCARMVARSGGSPWMARCLALGQLDDTARITADFDEGLMLAVDILRWLEAPVAQNFLDGLSRAGAARELVSRSFAEASEGRVRLHDVARQHLDAIGPPNPALARVVLMQIATCDVEEDACAALALAATLGERDTLAAVVRATAGRILAAGFGAAAWRALRHLPLTEQLEFRLACAAAGGAPEAVEWAVRLPAPTAPPAALAWATCMEASGRAAEAREAVAAVARSAEAPFGMRAATFVVLQSRSELQAREAMRLLDRPGLFDGAPGAIRRALAALCLLWSGVVDRAAACMVEVLDEPGIGAPALQSTMFVLFRAFVFLGQFRRAATLLDRVEALTDEGAMSAIELYTHALYAIHQGDLAAARGRIDRLSHYRHHDHGRFLLAGLRFRLAMAAGTLEEARAALYEGSQVAHRSRSPEPTMWTRMASIDLSLAEGREPPSFSWPDALARPAAPWALHLEIAERRAAIYRDVTTSYDGLELPEAAIGLRVARAQLEAECHASRGELGAAVRVLDSALALACAHGARFLEAEVLATMGRLLARAGDEHGARRAGVELDALASVCGFLRYRAVAGELIGVAEPSVRLLQLDGDRRAVQLGAVRTVSLEGMPIGYRLLEKLVAAGGAASKEQLVRAVWERKRYDSSRDNKRLQMAVRRLRVLLEDDPAQPKWLLTIDSGYALGNGGP